MAKTIGELAAFLTLNTRSFVAGMTTAQRRTKDFSRTWFDFGRVYRGAFNTLTNFVAPGAAIWTVVNQFRELGDLSDLSDRLNIDPKALQGFRLAAMDAGLTADDTTTSLQFMLKTVGEAAVGGKEATKAMQGLGLSVKDLASASSEEVLYQIADALSRIPDASVRAAKEVDIFGRSGAKLDAALKGGRSSLKGFEKEMAGLGRSFSKEQLERVDKAGDAFNRLKESLKGLADVAVINFGAMLEGIFTGISKAVPEMGKGVSVSPTDAASSDIDVRLPKDYRPPVSTYESLLTPQQREEAAKRRIEIERSQMNNRRDKLLQYENLRSMRNRGIGPRGGFNDEAKEILKRLENDPDVKRAVEEGKRFRDRRSSMDVNLLDRIATVLERIERKPTGIKT